MTTSLVTPGTEIGTVGEHQAGEGTTTVDNRIVATTTGYMRIDDGHIIVDASKSIVNIEIGDTVLCQFEKLQEKGGEARILAVEGKQGDVLPHQLQGHFHVTRIVDRFLHTVADAVRRRDVARAVVTEVEPVVRLDFRERDDVAFSTLFVHRAVTRLKRMSMETGTSPAQVVGMKAIVLLQTTSVLVGLNLTRSLSPEPFRKALGQRGRTTLCKGIVWSGTYIAADVREDGRERTYFRFEGQGQGGGRGRKAAPGCRLFVGGYLVRLTLKSCENSSESMAI